MINAKPQKSASAIRPSPLKKKLMYVKNHYLLYVMLILPLAYYIVFHYYPMYGVTIAFKNFSIFKGVWDSPWVGFANFEKIFNIPEFTRALFNTIRLNFLNLLVCFPAPIILALLLNEIKGKHFKKITQTVLYLPHFLSWVIIGGLVSVLFATQAGLINQALVSIGLERIPWLGDGFWWIVMYVLVSLWQSIGYGAIVYLSAISGIDQEIYEAARVDGCSRFKMMYLITLPSIRPTIVIMLILQVGKMFNVGYEKIILMYNPMTYEVADVINSYVYREGLLNLNYSYAAAVGMFNSIVSFILVWGTNKISNKLTGSGLW